MYILSLHMHFPPYSYTFTKSSRFAYPDMWLFTADQVFERITCILRSWSSLTWRPFSVFSTLLHSYCFHNSMQWTHSCLISFIHLLSCVDIYCTIVVLSYHHNDYITYSGYLSLAYIRGVLSSRIYVAILRRDSVFPYFGKWGMTMLLNHMWK